MRTFPEEIQFGAEENFSLQPDAAPKEIRTEAPAAADIGLTWYRGEDGCLRAFDGISILLALPSKLRDPELAKGHLRHIEGKEYLVFRL